MLIGRLCHASIDFGICGFVSTLGLAGKTQFGRWRLKMRLRRIMEIAVIHRKDKYNK